MRLLLTLIPEVSAPLGSVTRHHIQAMIYSHLMGTRYETLHERNGFKFFNFSNLFPRLEIRTGEVKHLIISSPNEGFIETLYEKLSPVERLYLGKVPFTVEGIKTLNLRPKKAFITDTPIVLRSPDGGLFRFYENRDLNYFLSALTENSLRKYRAFTGEDLQLDGPIFTRMIPYRRKKGWMDVYIRVTFDEGVRTFVGSLWKRLEFKITPDNRNLYKFLMDTGLGILNSLGFGFVNPVKRGAHPSK